MDEARRRPPTFMSASGGSKAEVVTAEGDRVILQPLGGRLLGFYKS